MSAELDPLSADCKECRGTGRIYRCDCEIVCNDPANHLEVCGACEGDGFVALYCRTCGDPAHHELGTLGRFCDDCAPGGCSTCAVWRRPCCRRHRFAPELKIICGEHPVYRDRGAA